MKGAQRVVWIVAALLVLIMILLAGITISGKASSIIKEMLSVV